MISKAKLSAKSFKTGLTNLVVTAALLATPLFSICQTPPPPNVDGGGPDAVPFDGTMTMMLLVAGVLFAAFITIRQMRKKAATA